MGFCEQVVHHAAGVSGIVETTTCFTYHRSKGPVMLKTVGQPIIFDITRFHYNRQPNSASSNQGASIFWQCYTAERIVDCMIRDRRSYAQEVLIGLHNSRDVQNPCDIADNIKWVRIA